MGRRRAVFCCSKAASFYYCSPDMALKHVDNFFWTDVLPGQPGTFTSTISASIASNRLVVGGNGGNALISNNITSQGTYNINVRFNIETVVSGAVPGMAVFNLFDSAASQGQCGLGLFSTGKLQFIRGLLGISGGAIGASSVIAIVADNVTFYDIEAKVVIGAAGSIECRVNGGLEIGPSVANTQFTANPTADAVLVPFTPFGSNGGPL